MIRRPSIGKHLCLANGNDDRLIVRLERHQALGSTHYERKSQSYWNERFQF